MLSAKTKNAHLSFKGPANLEWRRRGELVHCQSQNSEQQSYLVQMYLLIDPPRLHPRQQRTMLALDGDYIQNFGQREPLGCHGLRNG